MRTKSVPQMATHVPWGAEAVDGDDSLVGLVVSVNRKGYSLVGERARDPLLNAAELFGRELSQGLMKLPAMLSGSPVRQEHLIVYGWVEIIAVEVHGSHLSISPGVMPSCRDTITRVTGPGMRHGSCRAASPQHRLNDLQGRRRP